MNARTLQDDVASVVAWLVEGARNVSRPEDVVAELCDRLVRCGLPLHRVAVFVRTLHPDIMGRRFVWRPGHPVEISQGSHDVLATDTFRRSPMPYVFETGQPVRRKVEDPDCPHDFNILEELRPEGVTDYLIQPLPFTSGEIHAISWTTTRPGGFRDSDLAALDAIRLPLARLAEIYALRRTATNLLDTYVGRHAGEHILHGRIRRGDSERIEAVILLTDLRGFTTLSDQLPGDQVLGLLNRYFDGLVPAIERHGGEVLKFIGDGLLAIFAVADDPKSACQAALAATLEAREALATANAERGDGPVLRQGMALHLGSVLYGNIGSAGRLDFTAIGPAVNLTARLETVARDLGRDLVVSAAFAAQSDAGLDSLGTFALRGFREPQEVFAPGPRLADRPA
jgi:adenylate cyclase